MILRAHFVVLLCLAAGFMANAFYLKFKPPRSKAAAVQDIKSEAGKPRYPRHIDHITQWLRNKRRKQLEVLDRKDKRVREFLQQLILLIEQSQLPLKMKQKKHCHKKFGSIHDARNERVICERYASGELSRGKPEIKLVIPMLRYVHAIVLGKNKDAESDVDKSGESRSLRRRGSSSSSSDEETDDIGRKGKRSTRFEVVENHVDKPSRKKKRPVGSDSDDSTESQDDNDKVWNHEDESSKEGDSDSKSDSDEKMGAQETEREESHEPKKKKTGKIQQKPKSTPDQYVYMQGSRVYDRNRKFNRNPNYFMPKRYDWDSAEMNHLGYYWFEGPQVRNAKK